MTKFDTLFEKIIKGVTAFRHMVKYTFPDNMPDAKCQEILAFLESNPDLANKINELEHTLLTDPQWASFWNKVRQVAQKQNKLTDVTDEDWSMLNSNFINRLWGSRMKDGDELLAKTKTPITYLQSYDSAIQHKEPKDKMSFMATQMRPKNFSADDNMAIGGTR